MEKLEQIFRIFDTLAIIARNVNPVFKKFFFAFFFLYLTLKQIIASVLGIKVKKQKILGRVFYFSDYRVFITLFAEMFFLKPYEFETSNPKPIIIDAGTNIGLASYYFKQRYPNSKIICFEPSKRAFKHLKKNLSGFGDIKLVNAALAGTNGAGFLNSLKQELPDVYSSILNRWKKGGYSRQKTRLVKLSPYLEHFKSVDFVKLDIEGAEEKVLAELDKNGSLAKIKEMFVEYHYFKGNSLAKITTILEKNHFKIITYGGIRSPYPQRKNTYWCLSIFAYKDDK